MASDTTIYFVIAAVAIVFFVSICSIPIFASKHRKLGKRSRRPRSSSFGSDTTVDTWRRSSSSQRSGISEENIERIHCERRARENAPPVSDELPLYFNAAAASPSESLPGYESMIRHSIVPVAVSPAPNLPDVPHTVPITISNTNQDNTNRAGSNAQQSLPNQPTEQGPSPPYADTAVNAPQSAARIHTSTDVQSPESSQITVLMQRIDSMWAAIARLQQTQVERTAASAPVPVHRSSEISSPLPEYASVDDAFVEEGRSMPRPR